MFDTDVLQRLPGLTHVHVVLAREPQHPGLMKKRSFYALRQRFPLRQRSHRPARIQLVATVTHADDARLAAGTGAAVRRAISVEQKYRVTGAQQRVRSPGAENTGADDDEIEGFPGHAKSESDIGKVFRIPASFCRP